MTWARAVRARILPDTTEEIFVQGYAELIYAFEPSAEPMGTYKHIMNVFSPDTLVELARPPQRPWGSERPRAHGRRGHKGALSIDDITLPAEIEAGEKTGEGPLMPEQRRQLQQDSEGGGAGSGEQRRIQQGAEDAGGDKQGAGEEPTSLGPLSKVSPVAMKLVAASWGLDLHDVEIIEDASLRARGVRGAVSDAQTVRLAPGQSADIELLLEELCHIAQFRNAQSGELAENAPRDPGGLEAEASKAVEAALAGKRFEIEGGASSELRDTGVPRNYSMDSLRGSDALVAGAAASGSTGAVHNEARRLAEQRSPRVMQGAASGAADGGRCIGPAERASRDVSESGMPTSEIDSTLEGYSRLENETRATVFPHADEHDYSLCDPCEQHFPCAEQGSEQHTYWPRVHQALHSVLSDAEWDELVQLRWADKPAPEVLGRAIELLRPKVSHNTVDGDSAGDGERLQGEVYFDEQAEAVKVDSNCTVGAILLAWAAMDLGYEAKKREAPQPYNHALVLFPKLGIGLTDGDDFTRPQLSALPGSCLLVPTQAIESYWAELVEAADAEKERLETHYRSDADDVQRRADFVRTARAQPALEFSSADDVGNAVVRLECVEVINAMPLSLLETFVEDGRIKLGPYFVQQVPQVFESLRELSVAARTADDGGKSADHLAASLQYRLGRDNYPSTPQEFIDAIVELRRRSEVRTRAPKEAFRRVTHPALREGACK